MSEARVHAAMHAACRAVGVRLNCTYPECKCQSLREQIPAALAAADAVSLANGAEVARSIPCELVCFGEGTVAHTLLCDHLTERIAAALAGLAGENARLREALKPFVAVFAEHRAINVKRGPAAAKWFEEMPGAFAIDLVMTMDDCRAARAALQEPPDAT